MQDYLKIKTLSASMPALVPLVWSIEREAIAALLNAFCKPLSTPPAPKRRSLDGTCGRRS
jgi:hypothetical protein